MPAYVILDLEVTDAEAYEEYKKLAPPTVAAFGGKYLVRGGAVHPAEGNWVPSRLVVLEFDSVARAKAWLDSPEYAPARKMRLGASRSRMVIVEGAP